MKTIIRTALNWSKMPLAAKIQKARNIIQKMENSGYFDSPVISYSDLAALINDVETALQATINGTTDATAHLHTQETFLISSFNFIKAYVERVANEDTTNATAIILASGLDVKSLSGSNTVSVLTLKSNGNGSIAAICPVISGRGCYLWQYTATPADTTSWIQYDANVKVKSVLTGLTPGTKYYLRFATITKNGQSAWCEPVSIIVT